MTGNDYEAQSEVFYYSCTHHSHLVKEHVIPEHAIVHVYSGYMQVKKADRSFTVWPGETILFAKNELAKIEKHIVDGEPLKSVAIFFTPEFLQQYYLQHKPTPAGHMGGALKMERHPLLDSLFDSILPYYEMSQGPSKEILGMKLNEAITIIRQLHPAVDGILKDFAEPGKIDIGDFMQKNFSFNIPSQQFAYLTGRSLATFKRDFQKHFNTSPQKWLVKKRLEQAHYLIEERRQRPSEVYLEVGFENLSHFSYAFKQFFGYNPSQLSVSHSANKL
jgi:AraC-like DNA-binding protein